jgi:hypothetical protein
MTTITILKENTYDGKVTGHSVTLADGTTGYLDDKGSTPGLRANDSVNYTLAVKKNKKGGNYNLLTLTLASGTSQSSTPPPPSPQTSTPSLPSQQKLPTGTLNQSKATATIKAMEFMIDCFIADKVTWEQIQPKHKELTGYLNDAIDECGQA